MGPMSNQVFATSVDRHYPFPTGDVLTFTHWLAPWKMWFSKKARYGAFFMEMDPMDLFNTQHPQDSSPEDFKKLKKKTRRWKLAHIPLLPSATK